jgi:hypothetical protein
MQVNAMFNDMTRTKLIAAWFGVVALMLTLLVAFRVTMTLATGVMLAALCLVPPGIIFKLWPDAPPTTVADVLRKDA